MARTTRSDLDKLAETLSRMTGDSYYIDSMSSGKRLEKKLDDGGATHISPRLSSGALERWMHAYRKGIQRGVKLNSTR